jgi:hypothetical protein
MSYDGGLVARRGVPGHFGRREMIFGEDWFDWWAESALDGSSAVLLITERMPGDTSKDRLWVATRRPGRRFRRARPLWRAPRPIFAYDVAIAPGERGILAWASPWSILAARVSDGRVGPVQRVAASAGRVDDLGVDVAKDGAAMVTWVSHGRRRAVHAVTFGASIDRWWELRVRSAVTRPSGGDPLAIATPGTNGLLGWTVRRPGERRLWTMTIRHGSFGAPHALTPPRRVADWLAYDSTSHNAVALLWRERPAQDPRGWAAYAAGRTGARWVAPRMLLSDTDTPLPDGDLDIDPCTGRPTAAWVVRPSRGEQRIVSVTGPRLGRRERSC